jgi:molybdopterin synthase catalytic subunit
MLFVTVTRWLFSRQSRVANQVMQTLPLLFPSVRIQVEPFDVGLEMRALRQHADGQWDTRVGAVATFVGTVRELNQGDVVQELTLEHYPGMTESSIQEILKEAAARWPLFQARVIHRIGRLLPADEIVWVGVTSAHREDALLACAFIMDFLKSRAPFWKKESTPSGSRWVDPRAKDDDALKRWT